MRRNARDVLEEAEKRSVEFVRLQFTDILGLAKNVTIPCRELPRAFEEGIMFDGSSVEGFARVQESDMFLRPDPDTFAVLPWHADHPVARLICDIHTPDGGPFAGDPRRVLKNACAALERAGFCMMIGPEIEFFLFRKDAEGRLVTRPNDEGGYFDLAPADGGKEARRDIILALERLGFEIEASHHEVAPGQHEIDFRYADALTAADRAATFKIVTRAIAGLYGLHATFMPKPLNGVNGSGMHMHISLFKEGRNVFHAQRGEYGLSDAALWFIGGLMRHAAGMTAVTNPLVNSYKRLVPGFEAPVYITWSPANRSALIRVPSARGASTRLELRHPDPSCNPYLAMALVAGAGLDGLAKRIDPPPPISTNIYRATAGEHASAGIARLPRDLGEAVEELLRDEVMLGVLGEHVYSRYIEAKRIEWELYRAEVHDWELRQYLRSF